MWSGAATASTIRSNWRRWRQGIESQPIRNPHAEKLSAHPGLRRLRDRPPSDDGKVEVDGVDLTILTDMDSATRHWRFLRNGEFDVAEVSSSSYLAARDNDWPFRAIPVFLHRRFRHGFMFINTAKGIKKPADLKAARSASRR